MVHSGYEMAGDARWRIAWASRSIRLTKEVPLVDCATSQPIEGEAGRAQMIWFLDGGDHCVWRWAASVSTAISIGWAMMKLQADGETKWLVA